MNNDAANNDSASSGSSRQNENARIINLELLRTILMDFSPEELETEIFRLNQVTTISQPAASSSSSKNLATKKNKTQTMKQM